MKYYDVFPDSALDASLDSLGDTHRRRVLLHVSDRDRSDDPEPIVDALVPDDTPTAVRHRLRVVLYHLHLPKLDELDYIEWDQSEMTVERGSNFEEIEPILDLFDENESVLPESWP